MAKIRAKVMARHNNLERTFHTWGSFSKELIGTEKEIRISRVMLATIVIPIKSIEKIEIKDRMFLGEKRGKIATIEYRKNREIKWIDILFGFSALKLFKPLIKLFDKIEQVVFNKSPASSEKEIESYFKKIKRKQFIT